MLYLIWRFKTPICVITLLILTTVACQSSPAKCCQLDYGLLEITDLAGNWTAAGDIGQEMMESTVKIHRYEQAPVVENAKRYLLRDSDPSKPTVGIFQDLRRYERAAPPLAQLDFRVFSNAEASSSFDPGVAIVGESSQASCQSDNPSNPAKSLTLCVAEARYRHLISITFFEFAGSVSDTDIREIINQALSKTDQRIKQIDQHWSEQTQ